MKETKMTEAQSAKLSEWRAKFEAAKDKYSAEIARMDEREKWYDGRQDYRPMFEGDSDKGASKDIPHCRNICAEMIEDQIDSTIPSPKVTARRAEDEDKARLIENMIRNTLDMLPFERINDLMSRVVLIQGGGAYLVEWDDEKRTHDLIGDLSVTPVHPKNVIPQPGVDTSIEDMDYVFVLTPTTRGAIERRFGVVLPENATEDEPDARSADGEAAEDDCVTLITAYFRSEGEKSAGIGKFSWVDETVVEDFEDYQARRLRRCANCGAPEGVRFGSVNAPSADLAAAFGLKASGEGVFGLSRYEEPRDGVCPVCGGSDFVDADEDYEEIWEPITISGGTIPGAYVQTTTQTGEDEAAFAVSELVPTKIPYYKPAKFPVILQKNVSQFGRFLGESDIDKLESYQNTINGLEREIIEKLMKGGSFGALPPNVKFTEEGGFKIVRLSNPADKELIGTYTLEVGVAQDMSYLESVYKEAQQAIGVTDAFLGRRDPTAASGKAKELSAQQAAGRLQSKLAMKRAAYADLFELLFKFRLAYGDEPFPVLSRDVDGNAVYDSFNRYDFLRRDEITGEWYWNDDFLFDAELAPALASNREGMWQETRLNLQTGAFGNPAEAGTLVTFWRIMEENHYPGAGALRERFEELQEKQAAMQQQAAMQAAAAQYGGQPNQTTV